MAATEGVELPHPPVLLRMSAHPYYSQHLAVLLPACLPACLRARPPACLPVSLLALQKFGMTDHATFGVSFESNDLFVPVVEKKAQASKKLQEADDSSSNKPGHVLKSLLPAGQHSSENWEGFQQGGLPGLLERGVGEAQSDLSSCWVFAQTLLRRKAPGSGTLQAKAHVPAAPTLCGSGPLHPPVAAQVTARMQ